MNNIKIKVGDIVRLKSLENLGELEPITHHGPYVVESVSGGCVKSMSGIAVTLSFERFEKVELSFFKKLWYKLTGRI